MNQQGLRRRVAALEGRGKTKVPLVATFVPTGDLEADMEQARARFRDQHGCDPIAILPENGR